MTSGAGDNPGPTAVRILLGSRLRRAREAAGISPSAAAYRIRASASKISRLELGRVGFKSRDVADLLTLYGLTDEDERARLLALADGANTPGWWQQYADVLPSWFEAYVGLEEAAAVIRTYEVQFVPGLLQTADYAAAVTAATSPGAATRPSDDSVANRVQLRLARQQLLSRPDPPHVWAVVDEAALRRPIGGRQVMRAQLEHLLEMAKLPAITLQVMPFRYGAHAAEGGAFILLRFVEPDIPDVVYLESLAGATYLDDQASLDIYIQAADRLAVDAADPATSMEIIAEIRDDM